MNRLRMLAQQMQEMGRNGDTVLAHITKDEAAHLKQRGGAGSTNPHTGLLEFWEGDPSDPGGYGGPGSGSASTGNAGDYGGNDNSYGGGSDLSGFAGGSEMGGSRSRPGDPASGYEASEGATKAINDMIDMNLGGLFGTGFGPRTDDWASPNTWGRALQEYVDGFSLTPDTSLPTGQNMGFLAPALGLIAGPAGALFGGLIAAGGALQRAGATYENIPDRPTDADPATASYTPSTGVQAQSQTNALRQVIPWYVGTIRG